MHLLGTPLPDSNHAVSVSMPLWEHIVGYEEGREEVISKLPCGYPRFLIHPSVQKLFALCEDRFAGLGERCFAFPSLAVAKRCCDYLKLKTGVAGKISEFKSVAVVTFPDNAYDTVKSFWQHGGEIISSRMAEALLSEKNIKCDNVVFDTIKDRVAGIVGVSDEQVLLYPSGMAAIYHVYQVLQQKYPDRATVQLGFAYVDTVKIQENFNLPFYSFPMGNEQELDELEALLTKEKISAVFCEFPTNPLLQSINLKRLSSILRKHDVLLVIDDTVGTFFNTDLLEYADIIVSSLTKYFSGTGDVMAGSLVFNELGEELLSSYENLLWSEDAKVLEKNSRDFLERIQVTNKNAEALADFLHEHPSVQDLYYPKYITPDNYHAHQKQTAGYGGLLSLVVRDPEKNSAKFYDSLEVAKGPSLGTNFTLACPYTLLAHYEELDWAEERGVSRYLIRVSVGLEPIDELINVFSKALRY